MALSVYAMPGKVVIVREVDGERETILLAVRDTRQFIRHLEAACRFAEEVRSH